MKQPSVVDERFDYVLFTDSISDSKVGVWEVRDVEYDCKDLRKKSRFPKIHPELLLSEYEASLYIDGSIIITSQYVYDRCVELVKDGIEWAGMLHTRNCVYDEINAIVGLGWVHDYEVLDWYRFLRKEHFPDHYGLFENGIIFRIHTQNVKRIDDYWWISIERFDVKRDQFSLMWAIWKAGNAKTGCFLPESQTIWANEGHFIIDAHNSHKRELPKSLWEKLRDRYIRMFYWDDGWEVYYTHWFDKLLQWPFPHLMLHLWTGGVLIRYDLSFLARRVWRRIGIKTNLRDN